MTSQNKILIVDDEENIRWVFAQALEEKPLTVHTAASAEEALEKMTSHNYLLVFTDIFMPGMGGMDLLEHIKSQQPQTHVIVMTAQARENVKFGLEDWLFYFQKVANLPLGADGNLEEAMDQLVEGGFAVIGSPDDAIRQIERLQEESGGFGAYLVMATNWADWAQTKRSYELIARYVMPHFQGGENAQETAYRWAMEKKPELLEQRQAGIDRAIALHKAERG